MFSGLAGDLIPRLAGMPDTPSGALGVSHTPEAEDQHPQPWPSEQQTEIIDGVEISDTPTVRVHHPGDLVGVVTSALGAVLLMVLATYAQNTTTGVAEDVQGFASVLRSILIIPVAVLEGIVTLVVPVAVLTELAVRRLGRQVLEALGAGIAALLLCSAVEWALTTFGTSDLVDGLSVRVGGDWTLTVPGYVALLAGLLTTAGPRGRRKTIRWSWNMLWVAIGVVVITGQVSLPGVMIALLVGRVAGLGMRYLAGVQSERAYGAGLIAGIRRVGFDPERVIRVPEPEPGEERQRIAADAYTRNAEHRLYSLTTTDGRLLDVLAFDGDRQVVGSLSRLWRSLRLRGIDGRSVVSMRQAAERSALLSYAARSAGVRTPQLLRIAEAQDSMLLIQEHLPSAAPLADLKPDEITDDVLEAIWSQLRAAHAAGLAHRALTSDSILVDSLLGQPVVWLVGWETGDVASSELARRMDVTQVIALLALRVGAERAVQSAVAVLPDAEIAAVGPLLQTIALPRQTREEMRQHKDVMAELRSALVKRLPEADVEPTQLVRFGARTLLTILLTVVAAVIVLTTVNVKEISDAISQSDWRWSIVAFALGLFTHFAAALVFVAFSPVRLSVWKATLTQTAAAFVAVAAPAGIGPAALNLRMLTKRGVSTTLAAATVALVQVSQFVVTIVLLLVLSVVSGTNQAERFKVPPLAPVIGVVIVVLVAALLLVPGIRQWAMSKVVPTLQQTWPRLIEVVGQPRRLALAFAGNVGMTLGYVFAFEACLAAFGEHLTLIQVALIYLAGNTAGAVVPVPGGIGTIEVSMIALLAGSGVNAGVATSVVLLFRALTYWLRIPIGWVAMRYMQRKGEL